VLLLVLLDFWPIFECEDEDDDEDESAKGHKTTPRKPVLMPSGSVTT
jgi:hypothetical protein